MGVRSKNAVFPRIPSRHPDPFHDTLLGRILHILGRRGCVRPWALTRAYDVCESLLLLSTRWLTVRSFGTLLTAFAVASIGATCYEIPLLFSNRRAEMKLWLVLRVVLNGLWTALPIIYLVWLINNPYLVPYTLEVVGMVAVW